MSEKIYNLTNSVLSVLDGGWILIIALSLQAIIFTVALLLTLLKPLYSLKNRAWFFIASLATSFLELFVFSVAGQVSLIYLSLFFTACFCGAIASLPQKPLKIKESQRELARLIDKSVKEAEPPLPPQPPKQQESIAPLEEQGDASKFELDFQHVKLVVQKLEYYPLSANDKKLVRELEENIYLAENQGFSTLIKCKINDGLGALLKIMSKYGV